MITLKKLTRFQHLQLRYRGERYLTNVIRSYSVFLFLLAGLVLLPSCSVLQSEPTDWSADWPPESYFQAAYQLDKANQTEQSYAEYILWIKRFYSGWLFYPGGWDGMVQQLLTTKKVPVSNAWFRQEMLQVGASISSEWAKSDNHRLINSRHLLNWSDAVRRSVALGQEKWLLAEITADIVGLLDGTLSASVISSKPYFASDNMAEEFGDDFDF